MNVLVGGGTGFVGRHLVKVLTTRGAKVQVISRRENKAKNQISWDSIEKDGLPHGIDSVVNLAGRNIFDPMPWFEPFKREIYNSRIDTNRILAEAINNAANKPKSFINISGVGYYDSNPLEVHDETWKQSKIQQKDFFMDLANDWENAAKLKEETRKKTRQVIIRSGVVLGSDGGMVLNLKIMFSMGLGQTFGNGQQWFPWIHVDDLASLFDFCITNDNVSGIINGVSPQYTSKNIDFAESFAKAYNTSVRVNMPEFLVKLTFGLDRAGVILKSPCVKTRAEKLGFEFKYPTLDKAFEQIAKR